LARTLYDATENDEEAGILTSISPRREPSKARNRF
jgi:hypothetical protein